MARNNLLVGGVVTTTRGSVLKGRGFKKVENHCLRASRPRDTHRLARAAHGEYWAEATGDSEW